MKCRESGITLLEVALAGAVLLGGLAIISQLVRSSLTSTTPGSSDGLVVGPIVDQQLKLHAAYFKGIMKSGINSSQWVRVGSESIYTVAATRSYILPPAAGFGGRTYALTEEEITAKMTVNSTDSVGGPMVGFTRFWKLDVTGGTERAGL